MSSLRACAEIPRLLIRTGRAEWIYIYIYINILRGKKDATTFSRQSCFVNRFTLQGFNKRVKSEAIHETGLSGKYSYVLFSSLNIYSALLQRIENRLADSLYIYIYIYIYILL